VALTIQGKAETRSQRGQAALGAGRVPRRILEAAGPLKRVANGAELHFRGKAIAKLRSEGWARVIAEAPNGLAEVLAAADDQITVRALVDARQLADVEPGLTSVLPAPNLDPPELSSAQR
jgi:hypothetical protein